MEEKVKKTKFFVEHWVAALAVGILLCLVGLVSIVSLPVEQYPNIAPPMVIITANYSGADASAVQKSVIMPIEEQVNGVEDMMYMTSGPLERQRGNRRLFQTGNRRRPSHRECAEPREPSVGAAAFGSDHPRGHRHQKRELHPPDFVFGEH